MEVTRVIFYSREGHKKSLALCSVVIDDELRLNDISLYKGAAGYFLILPSKQDIYQEVEAINRGVSIKFPKNSLEGTNSRKKYEEFFHPLKGGLYKKILEAIVAEYEKSK